MCLDPGRLSVSVALSLSRPPTLADCLFGAAYLSSPPPEPCHHDDQSELSPQLRIRPGSSVPVSWVLLPIVTTLPHMHELHPQLPSHTRAFIQHRQPE